MKWAGALLLPTLAFAQTATPTQMVQLMESTAAAIPGLTALSEPIRQSASVTAGALERTPLDLPLTYRFISQVKAYLAVSDAAPRPSSFSETAARQYAELREDLDGFQRRFDGLLGAQVQGNVQRDADPNDMARYAAANTKLLPQGKLPRVVFLGDSVTAEWRLNEYFTGRDFINRGIGGQTASQMLARFRQDVIALQPKAVLIEAGTIDVAHGIANHAIEDVLTMMGDLVKLHGIKPLFAAVLPVAGAAPTAAAELNQWLRQYCAKQGFAFIDYYTPLADATGKMPADVTDDGLNPNAKGYRIMAPLALEAIGRAIANVPENLPEPPAKRRFRMLGK